MKEIREKYQHKEISENNYYYWKTNKDLEIMHKGLCPEYDELIKKWENKLFNKGCYIKSNFILFTYKKKKYWDKISNYSSEWKNIKKIIKELKKIKGIKNIYYLPGELD